MPATSIEWCDHSINPIRARLRSDPTKVGHYCEKIAPGCAHCYSSAFQPRFGLPEFGSGQKRDLFDIFLDESKLQEVRKRKKPTRYFWCDMTDIFGDWMQPAWLAAIFATIDATPQHTHLLLTKRPQNVRRMWSERSDVEYTAEAGRMNDWQMNRRENVHLLTSISDQQTAAAMIPPLLECRDLVPVLGLSCEPLLGPVNLRTGRYAMPPDGQVRGTTLEGLDWVIIGGESGPHARPCRATWVRDIVRQCADAGVACFVKQLGANAEEGYGVNRKLRLTDSKGGNWDEWPADLRVREFPTA